MNEGERTAILETKLQNMKETVERVEEKLDNFIDKADTRYFIIAISIIGVIMPLIVFILGKIRK